MKEGKERGMAPMYRALYGGQRAHLRPSLASYSKGWHLQDEGATRSHAASVAREWAFHEQTLLDGYDAAQMWDEGYRP